MTNGDSMGGPLIFRWTYNTFLDVPQFSRPLKAKVDDVEIVIRYPQEGELGFGSESRSATCIATTTRDPDDRVRSAFADLAVRRLPEGGSIPIEHPATLAPDMTVEGNYAIVRSWLPVWQQQYVNGIDTELRTVCSRAIRIVRWRLALTTTHRVTQSFQHPKWSLDGNDWHPVPIELGVQVEPIGPNIFPPDMLEGIAGLIEDNRTSEALGHELFREAWIQRHANPRSALIVGIAAAEAGIKEFIAALEPGTTWLLENSPSPPLSDLLRKYLPQLLGNHKIRTPPPQTPNRVMNLVDEGVKLRNKVAHGIDRPIDFEQLENALLAIRDVLWMPDVFRGYEWARMNVRPDTLDVWEPSPA